MKERIRELAIEADIMAPTWNHVPLGHQKFAEMIVRECAVLIGSMEEPHQEIAKLVKQHFGVKE